MFILDPFTQRITCDDIFGRCCDENVTKVVVEDAYVVGLSRTNSRTCKLSFDNGWTVLADKGLDIHSRKRSLACRSASPLTHFTFFGPGAERRYLLRVSRKGLDFIPNSGAHKTSKF